MIDISKAKILVILSTYNGGSLLRSVLESYAELEAPEIKWALVVVDNASTDETSEILHSFIDKLPLAILTEPVPSKNRALNHAIESVGVSAELYVFTDDDAIPEPDFLRRWEEVLHERPDNELFGGIVIPYFRQQPPVWLSRYSGHFAEIYAQNDRPSGEVLAQDIYGPNMAVRGSILARGNRFNESIGPNSAQSDYPMGSETEFCIRVAKDSVGVPWFASGPKVRHIVRPNQTTHKFVGRRAYRHGRGVAMRQALEAGSAPLPRPTAKGGVIQVLRWCAAQLSFGDFWWQYNWHKGYRGWVDGQHRSKYS